MASGYLDILGNGIWDVSHGYDYSDFGKGSKTAAQPKSWKKK